MQLMMKVPVDMAELSKSERNVPVTPNNDFKRLHKAKSDTLRNKSFHHANIIDHLLPRPPSHSPGNAIETQEAFKFTPS